MRFLKLLVAVAVVAFTFLVAPGIAGLRAQEPQKVVPQAPIVPKAPSILDLLEAAEEPEPKPVVTCVSDPKVGNDRCVPKYRFSDHVDDKSTKRAIDWIKAANEAGADAILFEINSGGGSVPAGFELARAIEDSDAPVTCVVDGDAASMAFYLLQSCEKRMMTKRSRLMAHEPSLGGFMGGNPNNWQSLTDNLKTTAETMAYWCWHRLKISRKAYDEKTTGGKQWWFLSDEAKKVGAVDEIADSVKGVHKKMLGQKK